MANLLAFFGKLSSILAAAGQPILAWIQSHPAQIQKAIADLIAGQPLATVFQDLFAATGLKPAMEGVSCPAYYNQTVSCEDCCKKVCCGAADLIKGVHADEADYHSLMGQCSDLLLTLAACEDNPC